MAGKIITGTLPKVVEKSFQHIVGFEERDDIEEICLYLEKKNRIPECARCTVTRNMVWGTTELYWQWYEIEIP